MTDHNPNITSRPYRVVKYDSNWPELFKKYAGQIKAIFGDNLVEIHHFGSTSIPGMFAKPNIDVYALVKSLESVRAKYEEMQEAGFACRGNYSNIGEEYFTLDTPEGERIASIHVFEGSNERFKDYRNFRDYLIANNEERERYIALKRDLYEKYRDDYPKYDAGKKILIDELREKANTWAEENS